MVPLATTGERVTGIGHSMGTVSLSVPSTPTHRHFHSIPPFRSLTQSYLSLPKFENLILCEPLIPSTDVPRNSPVFKVTDVLIDATHNRRGFILHIL